MAYRSTRGLGIKTVINDSNQNTIKEDFSCIEEPTITTRNLGNITNTNSNIPIVEEEEKMQQGQSTPKFGGYNDCENIISVKNTTKQVSSVNKTTSTNKPKVNKSAEYTDQELLDIINAIKQGDDEILEDKMDKMMQNSPVADDPVPNRSYGFFDKALQVISKNISNFFNGTGNKKGNKTDF